MAWARRIALGGAIVAAVIVAAAESQLPALGAGGLLHPWRRPVRADRPSACEDAMFQGAGVKLAGWRCRAAGPRLATLVYLHGVADNRASAVGAIETFTRRGFDVLAYDSRAHGESEGDACTYGFFEKQDLQRVLDTVDEGPIVLLGTSLGAAVALQAAALDRRVAGVVAAETFSDLRTVASERAPFVFTSRAIRRAFERAEAWGHFDADAVSPEVAARSIRVPVLLIHGAQDRDTPPDHSRRVYASLAGPKRLILVPGAGHNRSLREDVWRDVERWVVEAVAPVR